MNSTVSVDLGIIYRIISRPWAEFSDIHSLVLLRRTNLRCSRQSWLGEQRISSDYCDQNLRLICSQICLCRIYRFQEFQPFMSTINFLSYSLNHQISYWLIGNPLRIFLHGSSNCSDSWSCWTHTGASSKENKGHHAERYFQTSFGWGMKTQDFL